MNPVQLPSRCKKNKVLIEYLLEYLLEYLIENIR